MRHPILCAALAGLVALSACSNNSDAEVEEALKSVNAIDGANLSDIMLTVGDPKEAVAYFQRSSAENPDRIDLRRGLAKSLVRAGRHTEATKVWADVVAMPGSTFDDKVDMADAQIRAGQWTEAEATLNSIPPTHETFDRYKLEAMVADSKKDWKKADTFYDIAAGLTTKPSGVLNNWGFSKLTRGDSKEAEKLFAEALTYDPGNFTTKNNLVLARAAQRKYEMPVIQMTQTERAQLLYTAALSAIKQGDVTIGKGLLQDAIDTHPQHFDEAARALAALDAKG
ncbi:tetratricopeptide repeat protein [Sinirhodobacter sp. WL0062]|uniref:Tetratricopeptide repeat protein n=1 Tax=Rhodobacter flavimaris TaxID=2907145 RepID=A0ABS8YW21_9RHOB|nr:tetratricopeptide repeat protein [Sinirhodobacter sp. WL0062]MCE5974026.1 tetratricopeptide repeat protein [Sinirhodobacter sp. WL0062]